MKYIGIVFAFIAMVLFVLPEDADARRIGSARSFGGSSSFSTPAAKPPVTSGINNATGATAGAGAAAAGTMTRNSGMGMMGGMFGGLLAGSLIGSMLFGGAFAGGGLIDFLLIALLFYIGFRLFNSFRAKNNNTNSYQGRAQANYAEHSQAPRQESPVQKANTIDNAEFIEGAKTAYNRLQASWSKRDLEDIKIFTTKAVYTEIEKHFEEDPEPCETEIISLSAQINNIEKDRDMDRISVYFTCLMREGDEENAKTVTELWHFLREDVYSMWKVDGIQQV